VRGIDGKDSKGVVVIAVVLSLDVLVILVGGLFVSTCCSGDVVGAGFVFISCFVVGERMSITSLFHTCRYVIRYTQFYRFRRDYGDRRDKD